MRKYTPRAQRKPPGGSRAGRRARKTGGVGKPARFCQEETHVLAEQFGTTEHDGFRGPYLSGNTPEAAFHGQAGRPYSRTCCTARPSAPARLPCPGRRTTAARSARGAPVESPVVGLDIGLLLDSRGATRSSGAVPGASRARLFGVELDNPPRGVPCSVFPHECCRYPAIGEPFEHGSRAARGARADAPRGSPGVCPRTRGSCPDDSGGAGAGARPRLAVEIARPDLDWNAANPERTPRGPGVSPSLPVAQRASGGRQVRLPQPGWER